MINDKPHCVVASFKKGDLVQVKKWRSRKSHIDHIYLNVLNVEIYVLEDGGHFSANELELVK